MRYSDLQEILLITLGVLIVMFQHWTNRFEEVLDVGGSSNDSISAFWALLLVQTQPDSTSNNFFFVSKLPTYKSRR